MSENQWDETIRDIENGSLRPAATDWVTPENEDTQAREIAEAAKQWIAKAGRPNLGQNNATGAGPSRERRTRLPADLDARMSSYVKDHDITMAAFIRDAIKESLDRRTNQCV